MKLTLEVYSELKQKVSFFYKKLNFIKYEKTKGRKLAISLVDTPSLSTNKRAPDFFPSLPLMAATAPSL